MNKSNVTRRAAMKLVSGTALALGLAPRFALANGEPIRIGLSAAFSGPNALAGQAIARGAELAIDDINAGGGALGRPLELVTRDNEHQLARGVTQARELIEREGCTMILGSQGSFIGVAVIDTMEELETPWFGTSVGGVGIVENGRDPNYMFRVATNDRDVARFLASYAKNTLGATKIGILNEDTGWGVPAIEDLENAIAELGLEPSSVDKVKVGDTDFTPQMLRAKEAGTEVICTFTNTVEMANALKAANKIGYSPKVVSAWALASANFPSLAGDLAEGVFVMQTFTFVNNHSPKAVALFEALKAKYGDVTTPTQVPFPSYIGDTYDAVQLFAAAVTKAGTTEGSKVLDALQHLGTYEGIIKTYTDPFTESHHEALSPKDYSMTVWRGDRLELVTSS